MSLLLQGRRDNKYQRESLVKSEVAVEFADFNQSVCFCKKLFSIL